MKPGKLKLEQLEGLFQKHIVLRDKRVILGPKVGEDAAVIRYAPNKCLVLKIDPITFSAQEIGWYVVHINANDIATRGAVPRWFQACLLMPEGSAFEEVEAIFAQMSKAAEQLGITIVGGHTEITHNLDRPIMVGSMIGEVEEERLVMTSGARLGDDILLTKGIVIEGTAIIAREREEELSKEFSSSFIKRAKDYLYEPGISVVQEALMAVDFGVHSMHDPTEGGLAMGLYEVAISSQVGTLIYYDEIPILPEAKVLCSRYNLDPLGTITSGALLLTLDPKDASRLLEKYKAMGIKAAKIGKVTEKGVKMVKDGLTVDMPYCERDELTKLFE